MLLFTYCIDLLGFRVNDALINHLDQPFVYPHYLKLWLVHWNTNDLTFQCDIYYFDRQQSGSIWTLSSTSIGRNGIVAGKYTSSSPTNIRYIENEFYFHSWPIYVFEINIPKKCILCTLFLWWNLWTTLVPKTRMTKFIYWTYSYALCWFDGLEYWKSIFV